MDNMTMSCVCTSEVVSITLLVSQNTAIFNTRTTTVLSDGTELPTTSKSDTVVLPEGSEILADLLALDYESVEHPVEEV